MKLLWSYLLRLVQSQVVPALGCTEPVAIALAAAMAREQLDGFPDTIQVAVSANLYKNCLGVRVPGTGRAGVDVAAAAGVAGGEASAGLEVLKGMTPEAVETALNLLKAEKIQTSVSPESDEEIYVSLTARRGKDTVTVVIAGGHTRVRLIVRNGETRFSAEDEGIAGSRAEPAPDYSFRDICEMAQQAPLSDIAFILQAGRLNDTLSRQGLAGHFGLQVGRSLYRRQDRGTLGHDMLTEAMIRTSAASDARMGGAQAPAMSNSGSGNQGIAATVPVLVAAEYLESTREELARALFLSHLTAIWIHRTLPPLSAFCAAATAGMGAAAAVCWLCGGDYPAMTRAVTCMVSDVAGMFCDGASCGCALKLSTTASAAVKSALLGLEGCEVPERDGITGTDIDQTIASLGRVVTRGMPDTDKEIIHIMRGKDHRAPC
ncbi:serine dehydratase subunit alpha family protein [Salmonella enterica subsp. enterica serovar Kottbus]|nr:serine dehydratase subunit alpha family protein [Salmonella enterica subsp. enterica serovar Kottbus]EHN5889038.1 serine dehydratase subunit alpha family protein [Salmonella enterica subsp. enterica serovar Newport]